MTYTDLQQSPEDQEPQFNELEDGSLEAVVGEAEDEEPEEVGDFDTLVDSGNLAETFLSDSYIDELKEKTFECFEADLQSLSEHFEVLKKGSEILGIRLEEAGDLGDWSCGASHPLIMENAIEFQASVVNELDNPDQLVKTRIFGKRDDATEQKANRVGEFMNFYISNQMDTFYPESARCALLTALFGTGFKKNYWEDSYGGICSEMLRPDQVITNWETKSLAKSQLYTCVRPSSDIEIVTAMNNGLYRKIELDNDDTNGFDDRVAQQGSTTEDLLGLTQKLQDITGVEYNSERVIAEHYIYLDAKELLEKGPLDEDQEELAEELEANLESESVEEEEGEEYYERTYLPFLVITELMSGKVLGVYANWRKEDPNRLPKQYVTDYHFVRGFGFYSLGYVHLCGNFQRMLTAIMRSIVDAGTFANLPGGFKLRGVKIAGDQEIAPGEFKEVESSAQDISKAIMALPFKEPSSVLANMYQVLEGRGQQFANATKGVVSQSTNYGPVGTTLALLDASSKLSTAIIRDFHRSRRHEYKIIKELLRDNLDGEYPYENEGVQKSVFQEDFADSISVVPMSDPNTPNQAQRLALAQDKLQLAQTFPNVHNIREALASVYRQMGEQEPAINRLLPPPQQPQPLSPMEDITAASQSMPIKAFEGQNHQAHIAFKQAFIADPNHSNNEFLQGVLNALSANIREHQILDYQEKIAALGQQVMKTGAATDPASQAQVQAMVAQLLLKQSQQLNQMQENTKDPSFLIAQAQLKKANIDEKRIESSEKKSWADLALKKEELEFNKKKFEADQELQQDKIKADLIKSDLERKQKDKHKEQDIISDRSNAALDLLGSAAIEDSKQSTQKEIAKQKTSVKKD